MMVIKRLVISSERMTAASSLFSLYRRYMDIVTQYKGDISHAFKTAKIIVFNPMMCKSLDVPLQDELLP